MVDFLTINDNDRKLNIVRALISREHEIHSYDINIGNYETMILTLPTEEWPESLAPYRLSSIESVPEELHEDVANYQFRDRIKYLLSTEKIERNKSVRVYEALKAQIPVDELAGLVAQVLTEQQK